MHLALFLYNDSTSLILATDKSSYGLWGFVEISGTVVRPDEEKTVRLDVYDPEGRIFVSYNFSNATESRQSNLHIRPDDKGLFTHTLLLSRILLSQ